MTSTANITLIGQFQKISTIVWTLGALETLHMLGVTEDDPEKNSSTLHFIGAFLALCNKRKVVSKETRKIDPWK